MSFLETRMNKRLGRDLIGHSDLETMKIEDPTYGRVWKESLRIL